MMHRTSSFARARRLAAAPLIAFAATLLIAGVAGAATTATATLPSIYSPFTVAGKPAGPVKHALRGSCFSGSLAVDHVRAWRCSSGNELFDPCFSAKNAKGIVLCPATGPWSAKLIEIKLTKGLPTRLANHRRPSTTGTLPWALETSTGWKCRLDTGATTALQSKRLNYFCTKTKEGLWGSPVRTTEPWTILVAPDNATSLSQTVAITTAWF
jgi:hypothetical protein